MQDNKTENGLFFINIECEIVVYFFLATRALNKYLLSLSESDHWNKIIKHGLVDFKSRDFHFRQFDKLDTESL